MIKAIYYPTPTNPRYREANIERPYVELALDRAYGVDETVVSIIEDEFNSFVADNFNKIAKELRDEILFGRRTIKNRTAADIQDPFVWRTHDGDEFYPEDMASPHLFYSIRMLFNNVVPANYRVGAFKAYPDIKYWDVEYLYRAMFELVKELNGRDDLDEWQEDEFKTILRMSAELASNEFWYHAILFGL